MFNIKKINSILILGLLLAGLGFFASNAAFANEAKGAPEKQGEQQEEFHDTDDLEKMLLDYQKETGKILNTDDSLAPDSVHLDEYELEEMPQGAPEAKNPVLSAKKKKRLNLQNEATLINQLKGAQLSKSLELVIKQFENVSEADMRKSLREGLKGSKVLPYLEENPKMEKTVFGLMRDKEALPAFARIFEDKNRLIQFAIAFVITIIVNIIIKKSIYREKKPFWELVYLYFARVIFIMAIRFILIMYFFGDNLKPGIRIIMDTLKQ